MWVYANITSLNCVKVDEVRMLLNFKKDTGVNVEFIVKLATVQKLLVRCCGTPMLVARTLLTKIKI